MVSYVSRRRLAIRISHSFVLKMNSSKITSVCLFAVVLICGVAQAADQVDGAEEVSLSEEQLDYAKGSVCGYCTYCKVISAVIFKETVSIPLTLPITVCNP